MPDALDVLLFENLADLDTAANRAHQLEKKVFAVVGEVVEQWAQRNDWFGEYDHFGSGLWLAPERWRLAKAKKDDADGWFTLEYGWDDDEEWEPGYDVFDLTRLCQLGHGVLGFRFKQSRLESKGEWLKQIKSPRKATMAPAFEVDREPSFFLPVKIDPGALMQAIAADVIEDALGPLTDALEQLEASRAAFETLIGPRAKTK
jgi:hypothetical protein